jgi:hypothetical protein
MSKLIFMWMLATGVVQPMNEEHEGHELYILCIENDESDVLRMMRAMSLPPYAMNTHTKRRYYTTLRPESFSTMIFY